MRYFIAYKFTGENPKELEKIMKRICSALEERGNSYYCTLWEENFEEKTKKEMMEHAFKEIDNSEGLFVFVNSEDKSEGMLMEAGYSLGNKRIVLLINQKVKNTYLRELADLVIEFDSIEEIPEKMGALD